MMTCPDCKGTGMAAYMAFHIHERVEVEVTATCWHVLPKDEDEAFDRGENFCRMPRGLCSTCHGEGEIPEDY